MDRGPVEEEEMFRAFNMGIGYIIIVGPDDADGVAASLEDAGESPRIIGTIVKGLHEVMFRDK